MKTFKDFIVTEAKDELADRIRQELKKAGYKVPKEISVRKEHTGYSSSYNITIKSFKVDFDDVSKIAKKFNDIDYDEKGEILSGGNTYIFVEYDYDLKRKEEKRLEKMENDVIEKCFENEGDWVDIGKGLKICIPTGQKESKMNKQFIYNYKLNGKEYGNLIPIKYWNLPIWQVLAKAGF